MKIPIDLYYILNRQNFRNSPWRWKHSVEEGLERLVEKNPSFELRRRDWAPGFASERPPLRPYLLRESEISFCPPAHTQASNIGQGETIRFEPFAFHTGDEQPLRVEEARELAEDGEDLELMHVPVRYLSIPYGENFHTLTDRDFESVVGKIKKPVGLTWRFQKPRILFKPPGIRLTPDAPKKVEFLQECMVGFRVLDYRFDAGQLYPGEKSKEEAVQALSRLLNNRWFYAADNLEDFYWLNWHPMAAWGRHSAPGPTESTTTTFMEIPPEFVDTAEDDYPTYKKAQIRVIAAHEGDRKPIPVAKDKVLDNEDTDLMQVPLGYIGWVQPEKQREVFEQPVSWTWTEDWEESSEWTWSDGWEEPIELTWQSASGREGEIKRSTIQKIVFLRHYLKMIYIVDTGEGIEEDKVASAIEDLAGIELRHSTDSLGQDYWWKVQHDGSSTKSSSVLSGYNSSSGAISNSSSGAISLLELYGNKEEAHDHYWNTN